MARYYVACVETATGRIRGGGWHDDDAKNPYEVTGLSQGQERIVLPREPSKLAFELYDVGSADLLRLPTQDELDARDAEHRALAAEQFIASQSVSALIWKLIEEIRPPATVAKFNTTIGQLQTIYETKPWEG